MHLPDLDVVLEERGEELANQLTCQLRLLHRAEGVGEVRGDQTLLGRRPLGTACTCFEDLDSLLHIAEEADLLLYILVVIGVEEVVDGEALRDQLVRRDGDGHAGIDLIGVRVDPAIQLAEGIGRIEVVGADEGTDLRTVGTHHAVIAEAEVTHVVEDDAHVADVLFVERAEGFEAFALPSTAVTHDDDICLTAILQDDIDHSPVDGEVATAHLLEVVQREEHLLHIAEVVDLIAVVGVADEDIVLLVLVVEGALLLVPIGIAEDIDHIGLLTDILIFLCQLEEVGQPKAVAHKVLVEVDEGQEVTDLRWVEEPFVLVEDHVRYGIQRMLAEDAVARILLRVGDVGRVDDDGVDEGDRREALILHRIVPRGIHEDEPSVGPSGRLAVDLTCEAIDDLLRTAVDREDQLVEELIGLDEADVLHTISLTLVVDDGDALHTAPVVIEELDDLEEEVTVLEEGGILIVYLEDLFDAADAQ